MSLYSRKGFFFLEGSLFVVVGAVGIFSAALYPAMNGYLERSRDVARASHISSISTSLGAYYADKETYPTATNGCLALTDNEKPMYFPRGIPTDPTPGRTSGNCDGTGGTTYGYGTFTMTGGLMGYYLVADMENYNGGNSPIPPPIDADEIFFQSLSLSRGSGPYYILHNSPYDSFNSQDM